MTYLQITSVCKNCNLILILRNKQMRLSFLVNRIHMYPPVTFNNNGITKCLHQKHLGVVIDSKLDFSIDIEQQKIKKCNKIIFCQALS